MASPPTVLITGASRGLGLELACQYADDGWRVHATCRRPDDAPALAQLAARHPDAVRVRSLDVADHEQLQRFAAALDEPALDLVISNAGWSRRGPTLADVHYADFELAMRINAYATLTLAQLFEDRLAASRLRTLVAISSQMGSIAENRAGGRYVYRSSKAALNMVVRSLAIDLAPRGIVVACLHPGWVRTALGGPSAPLEVGEAVRGMRRVIAGLGAADAGRFWSWDGRELPW
jgi:NAD(P)-dependent dehydrogenase (short-subunit alcohol dehydrogenase family)